MQVFCDTSLIPVKQTVITQVADNASFEKTVQQLYSHPPNTIIVPDTMLKSGAAEASYGDQRDINVKEHLMSRLEDEYEIECIGVDRSHWNRETDSMPYVLFLDCSDIYRYGGTLNFRSAV